MKHVHYDKIVAKAANMELVVFFNPSFGSGCDKWEEATTTLFPAFHPDTEYFLCLPQHKEAVLNCLNGGESQVASISSGWLPTNCGDPFEWGGEWWYMNPNGESRIKPKKEKRWIGVFKDGSRFKNTEFSYETVDELKDKCWAPFGFDNWQFIEIEVEV